jgi:hypothetical protein
MDSVAEDQNQKFQSNFHGSIERVDFGTTGQLFDELREFFVQHPGLTNESVLKLTYFTFAIQFPERCNIWPCASVVASDTVGSSLLLKMMASVCIAPLQIGEATLPAILSLPQSPRPTLLLIDQLVASRELEHVLRIMSRPDSPIIRNGKSYDLSIPTLVCTAEPLHDRWVVDQTIRIPFTPTRGPLPIFDQRMSGRARRLKGKLLQYRETHIAKIRVSHFDVPELSSPTREIADMLGSCIADDSLQRTLPMLLEPQDRDLRMRRGDSVQAVVTEAMMFLSHEVDRGHARIGEITDIANAIFKGRGECIQLKPREVGDDLRALGLFSERLGSAGRGIRFTNEIHRKVHEMARAYDVRSMQQNLRCEFCAENGSRSEQPSDRK